MNFIQNVSAIDFQNGKHFDPGDNSLAIQICDPCGGIPVAKHVFKETHIFHFLDIEDGDEYAEDFGITDEQARELVQILQHAIENRMNVVVHCTAGVCRSGAVVEVGTLLGFTDPEVFRIPNMRVKSKMIKELGWNYENS